jgi:hypothetical protein
MRLLDRLKISTKVFSGFTPSIDDDFAFVNFDARTGCRLRRELLRTGVEVAAPLPA